MNKKAKLAMVNTEYYKNFYSNKAIHKSFNVNI